MLKIAIRTIPHREQEYDTVGNYRRRGKGANARIEIEVSEMGDRRYEFLVALHEMVEAMLCEFRAIAFEEITRFDIDYERRRRPRDPSEPGDAPDAPYCREHRVAELIERLTAHEMDVEWRIYSRALAACGRRPQRRANGQA